MKKGGANPLLFFMRDVETRFRMTVRRWIRSPPDHLDSFAACFIVSGPRPRSVCLKVRYRISSFGSAVNGRSVSGKERSNFMTISYPGAFRIARSGAGPFGHRISALLLRFRRQTMIVREKSRNGNSTDRECIDSPSPAGTQKNA